MEKQTVAPEDDSCGVVYVKFGTKCFKLGCSCEKSSSKRLKYPEERLGRFLDIVFVKTRFHKTLEEQFQPKVSRFFQRHSGKEFYKFREDMSLDETINFLEKMLDKIGQKVDQWQNPHVLSGEVSQDTYELDMRTTKGKIEKSKRDAAKEFAEVKIEKSERDAATELELPMVKIEKEVVLDAEVKTEKGETFFGTKTGKCYHRDGCGYLRSSKIKLTTTSGLTPCSRCCNYNYFLSFLNCYDKFLYLFCIFHLLF